MCQELGRLTRPYLFLPWPNPSQRRTNILHPISQPRPSNPASCPIPIPPPPPILPFAPPAELPPRPPSITPQPPASRTPLHRIPRAQTWPRTRTRTSASSAPYPLDAHLFSSIPLHARDAHPYQARQPFLPRATPASRRARTLCTPVHHPNPDPHTGRKRTQANKRKGALRRVAGRVETLAPNRALARHPT